MRCRVGHNPCSQLLWLQLCPGSGLVGPACSRGGDGRDRINSNLQKKSGSLWELQQYQCNPRYIEPTTTTTLPVACRCAQAQLPTQQVFLSISKSLGNFRAGDAADSATPVTKRCRRPKHFPSCRAYCAQGQRPPAYPAYRQLSSQDGYRVNAPSQYRSRSRSCPTYRPSSG